MDDNPHNLGDEYPDLSDMDQSNGQQDQDYSHAQPSKKVKRDSLHQDGEGQGNSKASSIVGPAFLGGKSFMPPPPPKDKNKFYHPPQLPNPKQNTNYPPDYPNRERKNCIYIENIAKSLNHPEKLNTFFKTYGNIKNVKVNEQKNSAIIRFHREQDALKFANSKAKIFNRNYILYSLNDDISIPEELKMDRETDENAKIKVEKETIILKQNQEALLADKFRCLLFLQKYFDKVINIEQIRSQILKCKKIKDSNTEDEEKIDLIKELSLNLYDWTLCFSRKTKIALQKKKIIHEFIKYGPIGTLDIKLLPCEKSQVNNQEEVEKIAVIRIKFLGLKSCWQMWKNNAIELQLSIQGEKLRQCFNLNHASKVTFEKEKQHPSLNQQDISKVTKSQNSEKVSEKKVQEKK